MFLQEWPQGITVNQHGGSKYLPAAYQVSKVYVFRDHIYDPEIKLHAVLMMMMMMMMITEI
jgi:hypothetical protein